MPRSPPARDQHEEGLRMLQHAAADVGPAQRILGMGLQPFSPPTRELVIDRQRYIAMFDALGEKYWSWFAVTASDQVHIDAYRGELPALLNTANALAPVVAALCGNSPISGGRRAPHSAVAGRDAAMIDLQRYGLPEHLGFEESRTWPLTSMEDWVRSTAELPYLLRPDAAPAGIEKSKATELIPPPGVRHGASFREYLESGLATSEDEQWQEFVSHERYVWHAARPRWQQGTIEFRGVCQQPHTGNSDHMVASAIALGCAESAPQLWELLSSTAVGGWPGLGMWYRAAVINGLAGAGKGPRLPDGTLVLSKSIELLQEGLHARGAGEEVYLEPLWQRIEEQKNPGQVTRELYEDDLREHRAAALLDRVEVVL